MAQKIDNEAWEKWPDEVMTEADDVPQLTGADEITGDYSDLPWDEWKKPGQSWVAMRGQDFADAYEFSNEVWRQAKASNLGVDVITWNPEVVFFRFRNFPETVADLQAIWDDADEDDDTDMMDDAA